MKRILFDAGWEVCEGADYLFMADTPYVPVHLPDDRLRTRKRDANARGLFFTGYTPGGDFTYRKRFEIPESWSGKRILIEFEGVAVESEVRVNGNQAAVHPYAYTSYFVDITRFVKFGSENEISVIAKCGAEPNSRWYVGAGIYRHVWLNVAGPVAFQPWGVRVSTLVASETESLVRVDAAIDGGHKALCAQFDVIDAQGNCASTCEARMLDEGHLVGELRIRDAKLWSDLEPNLYVLRATLKSGENLLDTCEVRFGVRRIEVDSEHGLRINGRSVKLRGGCIHHDNGPLGAAAYDRAEERKVELLKAAGFNAIRFSHNPPSPAMLDACDRLGVYTIDEAFDCWNYGKNAYDYHIHFADWWERDLESMVLRDYNHPCVIMWSYGNEIFERDGNSDGYAWSARLADKIRSLDETRPVNMAVNWLRDAQISGQKPSRNVDYLKAREVDPVDDRWGDRTREFIAPLNVAGYNYLVRRYAYDREKFPQRVVCGTETFPLNAYEFWKATEKYENVIGDFVWTAFDYIGEAGIGKVMVDAPIEFRSPYPWYLANCGDIDICGQKRPQSYFRDILWGVRTKPYIAVCPPELFGHEFQMLPWAWDLVDDNWHYPGSEGKPVRVDVYSADEEVELWLNGRLVGRKPAGDAVQNKTSFELNYAPGRLEAIGYRNGRETGRHALVTPGAARRLVLSADRTCLAAEDGDLAYVTVWAEDAQGRPVRDFEGKLLFALEGAAELYAVGSGDPCTQELFVESERRAYRGQALAVLRTQGQEGVAKLTVRCAGFEDASIEIAVQKKGANL